MLYLWVKAFHIIFMVTWFAGLFYLPRLYVYHAMPENKASFELFKVMERRLFIMMTLGAILTTLFGVWLFGLAFDGLKMATWFHIKLLLVVGLIVYHYVCYQILLTFKNNQNKRTHRWYRWFNELPTLIIIPVVILVVTKLF